MLFLFCTLWVLCQLFGTLSKKFLFLQITTLLFISNMVKAWALKPVISLATDDSLDNWKVYYNIKKMFFVVQITKSYTCSSKSKIIQDLVQDLCKVLEYFSVRFFARLRDVNKILKSLTYAGILPSSFTNDCF